MKSTCWNCGAIQTDSSFLCWRCSAPPTQEQRVDLFDDLFDSQEEDACRAEADADDDEVEPAGIDRWVEVAP